MSTRGTIWSAVVLLLAACTTATTPPPDRVATRVAEELAVAQTLTAIAPPLTAPTASEPRVTPTARVAPTLEPARPTAVPTAAPPAAPTATPEVIDPVVPAFGSTNGLIGEIVLPGYTGDVNAVVFRDRIAFRLKVFDPDGGTTDGFNIQAVSIVIFDPRGETVLTQTDVTAAYCAFDSDAPVCPAWVFAEHDLRWPSGTPVCAGQGYQANLNVTTVDGNHTDAFWGFNFGIEGDVYPSCF